MPSSAKVVRTVLQLYFSYRPNYPTPIPHHQALLGIEAAAVECERPFSYRPNHLTLGRACALIAENVAQTLSDLPLPELSMRDSMRDEGGGSGST